MNQTPSPNERTVSRYLAQYLLDSVPDETFFAGIQQLPAASFAEVDLHSSKLEVVPQFYYNLQVKPFIGNYEEACSEFAALFRDSVQLRLRSDVPLGFLLSGGLDSSLLCAQGKEINKGEMPLRFFSVVSQDPRYDESPFIQDVETHLQIPATKTDVSANPRALFSLLSKVQYHNDEPLTSLAAVSFYLMMEQVKASGLKVILSGQGADEGFCGYRKYLGFYVKSLLKQHQYLAALQVVSQFAATRSLISELPWLEIKRYIGPQTRTRSLLAENLQRLPQPSIGLGKSGISERQAQDILSFSVPALLHYEDRLSMAHSLELRAPYLDYRLVELGLSLPAHMKLRAGWSKAPLRSLAANFLPSSISHRRDKKGFTIPQGEWLKTDLRDKVVEMAQSNRSLIYEFNFVDRQMMQERVNDFLSTGWRGRIVSFKEILTPLLLENWLQLHYGSSGKEFAS